MQIIKVLVVFAVIGLAAGAGFVHSGIYAIGADEPHWPLTFGLIETLRERSIAARSRGIEVPPDLGSAERVRRGAGNYDAMCAGCHLKPGVDDSEVRKGLYPQPPNLAKAAETHAHEPSDAAAHAARQFWVIKHGIKMTAMPAWSKGGVDENTIWDMVALLQDLPALSPEDYETLVAASAGHSHSGREEGHDVGREQSPHSHDHPEHQHVH